MTMRRVITVTLQARDLLSNQMARAGQSVGRFAQQVNAYSNALRMVNAQQQQAGRGVGVFVAQMFPLLGVMNASLAGMSAFQGSLQGIAFSLMFAQRQMIPLSIAAIGLGASLGGALLSVKKAMEIQDMRDLVLGLTQDIRLAEESWAWMETFKPFSSFTRSEIVSSMQVLTDGGLDFRNHMEAVGNVAAQFNRDIADVAKALATAARTGDFKALEAIGVRPDMLAKAGVGFGTTKGGELEVTTGTGSIIEAFNQIGRVNFAGAMTQDMKRFSVQWKLFKEAAFDILLPLGTKILPMLSEGLRVFGRFLLDAGHAARVFWDAIHPVLPAFVLMFKALAGMVAARVFVTIVGGLLGMARGVTLVGLAAHGLNAALFLLGRNPLVAIFTVFVGLATIVIDRFIGWANAMRFAASVGKHLMDVLGLIVRFFKSIWDALQPSIQKIKETWDSLSAAAKALWEENLKPAWEAIKEGARALWEDHVKPKWDAFAEGSKILWQEGLKPTWDNIVEGAKQLKETVGERWSETAANFSDFKTGQISGWDFLWKEVQKTWRAYSEGSEGLRKVLGSDLSEIGRALETFKTDHPKMWEAVESEIQRTWDKYAEGSTSWRRLLAGDLTQVKNDLDAFGADHPIAWENIWGEIRRTWESYTRGSNTWRGLLSGDLSGVSASLSTFGENHPVAWEAVRAEAQRTWDRYVEGLGKWRDFFRPVFDAVNAEIITERDTGHSLLWEALWTEVSRTFEEYKTGMTSWKDHFRGVWDAIKADMTAHSTEHPTFWGTIVEGVKVHWKAYEDGLNSWKKMFEDTFNGLQSFLGTWDPPEGAFGAIRNAWEGFKEGIFGIWEAIKNKLAEGLRFPSIVNPLTEPGMGLPGGTGGSTGGGKIGAPEMFSWPTRGPLTQTFGDPPGHKGLDIAGATGTPIGAAKSGSVSHAGYASDYGNYVDMQHPGGWATRYAHLSEILVGLGESLGAGEWLGLMGSTGRSTGPHLHYEMRSGGALVNPLDWLPGLARGGIVSRPTVALIGEAGPEAVIPLNRGSSMDTGGGMELHVHVEGNTFVGNDPNMARHLADEVSRVIMREFSFTGAFSQIRR